jgi:type VI secretion system protein VasG
VFDKGMMDDGMGRRIDFKNTLIILTTNAGTDLISTLSRDPLYRDNPEKLDEPLHDELLKLFPPALLGRMVSIPYYPLTREVLTRIVRLHLGRVANRIRTNHGAEFVYDEAVVEHVVAKCDNPDAGGRMIDNIITNTLLPALSREFLNRSLDGSQLKQARVGVADGNFSYSWS